jgi:C4-dicarboxylate transporter DctQ subunit
MMKALKIVDLIEEYAAGILFLAALSLSLYGVFMRYVMNSPQFGILEIVQILLPWAIFLGFGRALKQNHHIAVDVVYDLFPFQVKRTLAVIANVIGAGFSFFLCYTAIETLMISKENGYVTTVNAIPIWTEYIILPISMTLLGIYFLLKAYKAFLGDKVEINGAQEHANYVPEDDEGGKTQ